jgi:cytochrome c-type biogenesis protein CcmH/NrfG
MKTENFARANIYFERASTMDAFKVDAWIQLGRLNVQQSNFKRALDYLNKANRLKPTQQLEDYIGKIKSILSRM